MRDLPRLAAAAPNFDDLASRVRGSVRDVSGVTVAIGGGDTRVLRVDLVAPLDAARVAALLGVSRPFAISGDVEQREWQMVAWAASVPDPNNVRIATNAPVAGRWSMRVVLVGRPAGALPREVAGASPAYDLHRYAAAVRAIVITPMP